MTEKALTTKITKHTKGFRFILTCGDRYFAVNSWWLALFREPFSGIVLMRKRRCAAIGHSHFIFVVNPFLRAFPKTRLPMFFDDHPEGLLIDVRVQPKSSRNAIVGLHDGALKVKLNAPPVEGKANKALLQLVAKVLRCPKSDLEIVAGQANRRKRLLVRIAPGPDFIARREALKAVLNAQI